MRPNLYDASADVLSGVGRADRLAVEEDTDVAGAARRGRGVEGEVDSRPGPSRGRIGGYAPGAVVSEVVRRRLRRVAVVVASGGDRSVCEPLRLQRAEIGLRCRDPLRRSLGVLARIGAEAA